MQIDDLQALMFREEAICDELAPYVQERGDLGTMIHHPLVIELMFDPKRCGLVNKRFQHKQSEVEKCLTEGKYATAIFLHERPYRFDALMEYMTEYNLEDEPNFWEIVGHIWTDSENIYESFEDWQWIWEKESPNREKCMSEDEREALAAMPDTLTIYRGYQDGGTAMGMSWTLDQKQAEWFAVRFSHKGSKGTVIKGTVAKSDVLAYFTGRNEAELVILPENVNVVHSG